MGNGLSSSHDTIGNRERRQLVTGTMMKRNLGADQNKGTEPETVRTKIRELACIIFNATNSPLRILELLSNTSSEIISFLQSCFERLLTPLYPPPSKKNLCLHVGEHDGLYFCINRPDSVFRSDVVA